MEGEDGEQRVGETGRERGRERGRCSRKRGVGVCTLSWRGVWVERDLTERKKGKERRESDFRGNY